MGRQSFTEDISGLVIRIYKFKIDVAFGYNFAQTSKVYLVCTRDVSELWGKCIADNKDRRLIVFMGLQVYQCRHTFCEDGMRKADDFRFCFGPRCGGLFPKALRKRPSKERVHS